MTEDLLEIAKMLVKADSGKPKQANLKRAISTAYYALFHALARDAADILLGIGQNRADKAWRHVYRSLEHGNAKNACLGIRKYNFPSSIIKCADSFVSLQKSRHSADYDPYYTVTRTDVISFIEQSKDAIESLKRASRKDRSALAVLLLLKNRD